jgi:2-polyprenyl-6-hydroxyphenyl methylase/3-demethylubiquinone-9 3-methyltransferase
MVNEVEKFDQIGQNWWNTEDGEFRLLHKINPLRIEFISQCVCKHFNSDISIFKKLKIIDIGCGGGLASTAIARLGAEVTGIDPSYNAILAAQQKAESLGLDNISYVNALPENFFTKTKYDVVMCLDVVEHVTDLASLVEVAANLLAPGGAVIISTINKTPKSFLHAIVAAEYVLRMLPKGTHIYDKFIRPSQLQNEFSKHNIIIKKLRGIELSILKQQWQFSKDISVNYLAYLA